MLRSGNRKNQPCGRHLPGKPQLRQPLRPIPGADGSNGTDSSIVQLGPDNKPYRFLPPVGKVFPAAAFPINLDNKCFNIDQYVPSFMEIPDVLHQFYEEQKQIDSGRMIALRSITAGPAG